MRLYSLALLAVISFQALALEGPDIYDESTLRCVHSFDVAGPGELNDSAKPDETVSYSNQDDFERLLNEKDRDLYLRKSYFNGTSEAKCYALLGMYSTKSASYEELKKDFLRYEKDILIDCRVKNLKPQESPSAVIRLIESGDLPSRIRPKSE